MGKKKLNVINREEDSSSDSGDDSDTSSSKGFKKPMSYDFTKSCKLGILIFVLFLLVMSDVFVERVMSKSSIGLVNGRTPTKKGMCAQGIVIVIAFICLDFLVSKEKI